jgi:hypothetical protein
MSASSKSLDPIARTQILQDELDRVLASATFRSSEIMRKLLSYLAASTLDCGAESVKAKDIATAVFNRSENFDSQSDSVVRVQMGRLRAKLAEHYVDEVPESDWVLTIPKGSYQLDCHRRRQTPPSTEPSSEPVTTAPRSFTPVAGGRAEAQLRAKHSRPTIIAGALAVTAMCIGAFWAGRFMPAKDSRFSTPPALITFWRSFVAGPDLPLVIFSNQKLVGSVNDLHAYRAADADLKRPLIQSWTTIGEVIGVFDLTKTLALFRKTPIVKPAHLLTWDDAKKGNLIVVGGPLCQTVDVNLFRDFQFASSSEDSVIPAETGAILNLQPGKGEARMYLGPAARPFDFDYALISLRPSLSEGHVMLTMAGITEYGTEAAADFLTEANTVEKLLQKLGVARGQHIPWFEALLRVTVKDGVPVQSTLVALHREGN